MPQHAIPRDCEELLSKVVDEDFSGGGFGFDSVDEFETLNYVG